MGDNLNLITLDSTDCALTEGKEGNSWTYIFKVICSKAGNFPIKLNFAGIPIESFPFITNQDKTIMIE